MKQESYDNMMKLTCRSFNPDETLQVLKGTNLWVFFSWGVSKLLRIPKKNYGYVGLLMKVNGCHHKGYVLITLNFLDLYDVHLLNNQYKVKESITDIYFDELFNVIDGKIERIPEYNR